ncbi:MAG: hypothetical protein SV760_08180 [Halobacteria archaeon]|nr:hypothetical protein [Halobacteria archaeon]
MVPFCETPEQSAVAGVVGGLAGGGVGVALGFDPVGVALLSGFVGGFGDLGIHAVRRDEQFGEAVSRLRK